MKKLLLATALVAAPFAASAATISSTGITGNFDCGSLGGSPAGQIDVLAGASFNAEFVDGESGGNYCFDLNNNSGGTVAVTFVGLTVNQLLTEAQGGYGFSGGVELAGSGPLNGTWAEGEGAFANYSFNLEAGDTFLFDFEFGDAYANNFDQPFLNFSVFAHPVPVPAAGFLLLGGLGGLAALKRRKS